MNILDPDGFRGTRAWLLARDAELRDRLERVQADLRRERQPLTGAWADAAIVIENDEVLQAIKASAKGELERIRHALARMNSGVFGLCEHCGDTIEMERVRVVPYATSCSDCERLP
jgi:DnaK suppressor protein